jgi:NADH-quinone oxidoreductase subunit G
LQLTKDNPGANARINSDQAEKLNIAQGDTIRVRMLEGDAQVNVEIDERIPDACIWVPAGYSETSALGACGSASVSKI